MLSLPTLSQIPEVIATQTPTSFATTSQGARTTTRQTATIGSTSGLRPIDSAVEHSNSPIGRTSLCVSSPSETLPTTLTAICAWARTALRGRRNAEDRAWIDSDVCVRIDTGDPSKRWISSVSKSAFRGRSHTPHFRCYTLLSFVARTPLSPLSFSRGRRPRVEHVLHKALLRVEEGAVWQGHQLPGRPRGQQLEKVLWLRRVQHHRFHAGALARVFCRRDLPVQPVPPVGGLGGSPSGGPSSSARGATPRTTSLSTMVSPSWGSTIRTGTPRSATSSSTTSRRG